LSVCRHYELSPESVNNIVTDGYISMLSIRVITDPVRIEEFCQCASNKAQANLLFAMLKHVQAGVTFDDGSKKGKRTAAAADLPGPSSSNKKSASSSKSKSKPQVDAEPSSKADDESTDGGGNDSSDGDDVEKTESFVDSEAVVAEREELLEVCRANFGNKFSSHVIMAFKFFVSKIRPSTKLRKSSWIPLKDPISWRKKDRVSSCLLCLQPCTTWSMGQLRLSHLECLRRISQDL
jgi:hypothetical protein